VVQSTHTDKTASCSDDQFSFPLREKLLFTGSGAHPASCL